MNEWRSIILCWK